jgi:hypothetical protein
MKRLSPEMLPADQPCGVPMREHPTSKMQRHSASRDRTRPGRGDCSMTNLVTLFIGATPSSVHPRCLLSPGSRNGVIAAGAEGSASAESSYRHPEATSQTILVYGFVGILRTGRRVPAYRGQVRRYCLLIESDRLEGKLLDQLNCRSLFRSVRFALSSKRLRDLLSTW